MKVQRKSPSRERDDYDLGGLQSSGHRANSSRQNDSILDNSDLSIVQDGSSVFVMGDSPKKPPAFQKGNRKGKQKYKVMYQVQKLKVPVNSNQTGGVVSPKRNRAADAQNWDSSLPRAYNKFRQSKSVAPRQKFQATLPAVLNEPSITISEMDVEQQPIPAYQPPVARMKKLKQKSTFTRKTYQRELSEQREADIADNNARQKYRQAMSVLHDTRVPRHGAASLSPMNRMQTSPKIVETISNSFNNPQQEAQQRQRQLLDQIRRISLPKETAELKSKRVNPNNGKLFILKDRSGQLSSGLVQPSERQLGVVKEPSRLGQMSQQISQMKLQQESQQVALKNQSISVAPAQKKQSSAAVVETVAETATETVELESPGVVKQSLPQQLRRESTATTANVAEREKILPVSPRQLVSEEGGIINLAVENEFDVPGAKNNRKKLRAINIKRTRQLGKEYDSAARLSPDSRYLTTAGTVPLQSRGAFNRKGTVDDATMGNNKREHARFLVELMSPFASRAGTQGITSVSNRNISNKQYKNKLQYHVAKLSPIRQQHDKLQQSQRNELPPSHIEQYPPDKQMAPTPLQIFQELTSQSVFEDEDEGGRQSVAVKNKSPFRQLAYDNSSDYNFSRNNFKTTMTAHHDHQSVEGATTRQSFYAMTNDSVQIHTAEAGSRMANLQKHYLDQEKLHLNKTSAVHLDHDRLPYMTMNSSQLASKRKSQLPEAIDDRVKLLPLNIQQQIKDTQKNQLYEFYEAMLQPSTLPFTQQEDVAHITPKIGDKVSMLRNVRETLTKRYQLAKAARIEANRRLKNIAKIRQLRQFIAYAVYYKPMRGMLCQKSLLLDKISYTEPYLVNEAIWDTLEEVYSCENQSQQIAAVYKLQRWIRMQLQRNWYKKIIKRIYGIQSRWKRYKTKKLIQGIKYQAKLKAVQLLQRQMRGYLAYQRYYARLKGTMTKKNLDFIITRYADAKEWMRECLQVQLAYLTRKMIKRKKIEAELEKKRKKAEAKRIKEEKERERLRKIHEERKGKKRQVRQMLQETVHLCWKKDDKRRDDQVAKEKKKQATAVIKKTINKAEIPIEAVTLQFKQELFEGCYKRINKRIAAAKKKAKANKDLKSVKGGTMKGSDAGSALKAAKDKSSKNVNNSPGTKTGKSPPPEPEVKKEPVLDPHHLQLIQIGRKVKMVKYDKHPNVKKRRDYKDMLTVECTVDCITKENEKFNPELGSRNDSNSRQGSKQSSQRKGMGILPLEKRISLPPKRPESPEPLNISVGADMGEAGDAQKGAQQPTIIMSGELTSPTLSKRNTIAFVQQPADTIEDIRIVSNDDLDMFDDRDPDASATSEELSDNSETYDFLMVYLPLIRPKEPDTDEEEANKEKKPKKGGGAKGGKKGLKNKAKSFNVPKLENNLADMAGGDLEIDLARRTSLDHARGQSFQLGSLGQGDDDQQQKVNPSSLVMEPIGEETIVNLPPPHTPLAVIPSREDLLGNKGKKGTKKKDGFTDFDKPFSQNGDMQQDDIKQEVTMEDIRVTDEKDDMSGVKKVFPTAEEDHPSIEVAQEVNSRSLPHMEEELKCLCEHPPLVEATNRDLRSALEQQLQRDDSAFKDEEDESSQKETSPVKADQRSALQQEQLGDHPSAFKEEQDSSQKETNQVDNKIINLMSGGSIEINNLDEASGTKTPDTEQQRMAKLSSDLFPMPVNQGQSQITLHTTQGEAFKQTQSQMGLLHQLSEKPKLVIIQSTLAKDSSMEDSNFRLDHRLASNEPTQQNEAAAEDGENSHK